MVVVFLFGRDSYCADLQLVVAPGGVGKLIAEGMKGGAAHHIVDFQDAVPPLEGATKGLTAREVGEHGAQDGRKGCR